MTPAENRAHLFKIAHALGHTDPTVWESRNGLYFASCSCGWESTYRGSMVDALSAGVHHALISAKPVAATARRSGRPLGMVIAAERRKGFRAIKGAAQRDRFKRAA